MANEFVIKNGFRSQGNSDITGSLIVTAGITGSLFGTASWAENAVTSSTLLVGDIGLSASPHYLTFVSSHNAVPASEVVRTDNNIRYFSDDNILSLTGSLLVGATTGWLGATTSSQIFGAINGGNTGRNIGVYGLGFTNEVTPPGIGDPPLVLIGGRFVADNLGVVGSTDYSVQLQDGTEGAGKVLVSQTEDGLANWSTRLSGSYEITGSLQISGSVIGQSGNTVTSDAMLQATLLYLSNNF